jgi:hypothetical protein
MPDTWQNRPLADYLNKPRVGDPMRAEVLGDILGYLADIARRMAGR